MVLTAPEEKFIPDNIPLLFLAGPIQGSRPWQEEAIKLLNNKITITNPRRPSLNEKDFSYAQQVDWESKYLRRAAANGVILFWLAAELEHDPGRAYAQTSRFELAEWKIEHQHRRCNLVIGIEAGFSGEKYIRHRMGQDCPDIVISDNLADTCQSALALV